MLSQLPGLARPLNALLFLYGSAFVFAALSLWLGADNQGLRPQLALFILAGSAAGLWVALLLSKPKPREFPQRTRFTLAEYWLASLVMSAALILCIHPGWHLSSQAPSGLMALLWGMGWVSAWLGPVALAVLVLLLAHWFAISLYLDYRQAWWRWQHEQHEQAMVDEIGPQLAMSQYLGPKDATWVARKLAQWLSTRARAEFSLALPASRLQVTARLNSQNVSGINHDEVQQKLSQVQLAPVQVPQAPQTQAP